MQPGHASGILGRTNLEGEHEVAGVAEVTDQNFEQKILQSQQPAVVDFWAEWCGPCRAVAPIIKDLAARYDGKVSVAKVDEIGRASCRERV